MDLMTSDILYSMGAVLVVLAIPALVTAYAERRTALPGLFMAVAGLGLTGWIYSTDRVTYAPREAAHTLFRVIGYALDAL